MTSLFRPDGPVAPAPALPAEAALPGDARDWVQILAQYRDPDPLRSTAELAVTLGGVLGLWALAWLALPASPLLAVTLALLNAGFLLRLFAIQHDCGHASFLPSRGLSDMVGRVLGVLTLTPYAVWRRSHSIHHASAGNLDKRGIGDVLTLTVAEYRARGPLGRLGYRLYRHPLVLFGLGPSYLFLLQNRVPLGMMNQPRYWLSAMSTNLAILAALGLVLWAGGWQALVLVWLPTTVLAATLGVWLFYVQHQFEETHWRQGEDWQLHDAALRGSSHYVLPAPLRWMTANLGIHHVHHLYSRIPFYRLPEVLADHPALARAQRMTIRESLSTAGLQLWDEGAQKLISFRSLRRRRA
jgi:omega-6 fatty acid desaturase (delta-12 desaturase)